ncbi:hypothetical protein H4R34_003909 [Dimargaris verticillata]|uniref:PI31 proteasome regulator C-terminal domain-containing protein n=1 Tax=Dimargaris verticillata TaxID=2761393 RepID=A0A9W8EBL6_9FUNG|nr:hypothetical protein H4R34_003909 [Dimargaris verticillata]
MDMPSSDSPLSTPALAAAVQAAEQAVRERQPPLTHPHDRCAVLCQHLFEALGVPLTADQEQSDSHCVYTFHTRGDSPATIRAVPMADQWVLLGASGHPHPQVVTTRVAVRALVRESSATAVFQPPTAWQSWVTGLQSTFIPALAVPPQSPPSRRPNPMHASSHHRGSTALLASRSPPPSVQVGDADKDPLGAWRDPSAAEGGGMLMGPGHPAFRVNEPSDARSDAPFAGPTRLPSGAVPAGARFDPIGPFDPSAGPAPGGVPRRPRPNQPTPWSGDPDNDELPPPGYRDMFM